MMISDVKIDKYSDDQTISFLRAIKYYDYLDTTIKLNVIDTLIITDGKLSSKEEVTPSSFDNYDEVYMSDLTLEDASYVILLLVMNKCTNKYNDKPFEYKTLVTTNAYIKDLNDIKTLEKIRKELSKINTKKINNMIDSSDDGIYKKVIKK